MEARQTTFVIDKRMATGLASLGLAASAVVGSVATLSYLAKKPAPITRPYLPLEVAGAQNTVGEISFSLANASRASRLVLTTHGITYAEKAALRINGGAWRPLSNKTVEVGPKRAADYGGIGGPISNLVLILKLDAGALVDGENTLAFRLEEHRLQSSGFRIRDVQVLDADGAALLPADAFNRDDSPAFAPGDKTLAERGKQIWLTAALKQNGATDAPMMKAHCGGAGGCHTQTGAELKMFRYANVSIAKRAQFHGLPEEDGAALAAYIRSLPVPEVSRPWNPPYQPGVGLDAKNWTAGAGLEAVLASDAEMLPYLKAAGSTNSDIAQGGSPGVDSSRLGTDMKSEQGATLNDGRVVRHPAVAFSGLIHTGKINLRELPIGFELPDLNHWFPQIHPRDAWPETWEASGLEARYEKLRASAAKGAKAFYAEQDSFSNAVRGYALKQRPVLSRNPEADRDPRAAGWTPTHAEKLHSLRLWWLMKMWELHQEFGLEEKGADVFGDQAAPRSWLTLHVWDVAPHEQYVSRSMPVGLADPDADRKAHLFSASQVYFNNAWFYLQWLLNDGSGRVGAPYTASAQEYLNEFARMSAYFGDRQPLRNAATFARLLQTKQTAALPGYDPKTTGLFQLGPLWRSEFGNTGLWDDVPLDEERALMQRLLDAWVVKTAQLYPAKPAPDFFMPAVAGTPGLGGRFYSTLTDLKRLGVRTGPAVDWARRVWPNAGADFEKVRN